MSELPQLVTMLYFVFLVAATAVWESSQAVQRSCTACELSQTTVAATRNQKYDKI